MSTIDGVVTYCSVQSVPHPHTGRLIANRVRVQMRQLARGAPLVEAVVDTGPGSDGLTRAQAMSMRLRPGTAAQAEGDAVISKRDKSDDTVLLVVRNCKAVRGGEYTPFHERTSQEAA